MRITTLLFAVGLALTSPASADEKALDRKAESQLRPVIRAHAALAKWCKRYKLERSAYRHYMEVIAVKDDDWSARSALGYVKKSGKWTLPRPKLKKTDNVSGPLATKLQAELAKRVGALNDKSLEAYRKLAEEAEKLELAARRRVYLERVLAYAPDDPITRQALGWTRSADGRGWVLASLAPKIGEAAQGMVIAEKTAVEKDLSLTFFRRRSAHYEVATFESDAMATKLVATAEASFAILHTWLDPQPTLLQRGQLRYYFFPSTKAYHDCIDKFSQSTPAKKAHGKKCASTFIKGPGFSANQLRRRDAFYQQDRIVYLSTRSLAWGACGGKKGSLPWLREGLAWEMTLRLLGTRLHHSVALKEGSASSVSGKKRWSDHSQWPSYLRELVLLDEAPRLAAVTGTRDINDIEDASAAMSWSLTRWMLDTAPKKLAAYCGALRAGKTNVEALGAAFGATPEKIEADWRAYVLARY